MTIEICINEVKPDRFEVFSPNTSDSPVVLGKTPHKALKKFAKKMKRSKKKVDWAAMSVQEKATNDQELTACQSNIA